MPTFPKSITIHEEGPREGFQIEPGPIPTARKIEFIEALAETGLKHIQVTSFVNPKKRARHGRRRGRGARLPAEARRRLHRRCGSTKKGSSARGRRGKLTLEGKISIYASEKFSMRNNNRTTAQEFEYARRVLDELQGARHPGRARIGRERVRLQLPGRHSGLDRSSTFFAGSSRSPTRTRSS